MASAAGASLHRSTVFPFGYIVLSTLTGWYPALLVLGLAGLTIPTGATAERTWVLTYLPAYLWLHGIPDDLWSRDFIVLTALLSVPAAESILSWRAWSNRPRVTGLAWGATAYVWLTPLVLTFLAGHTKALERVPFAARAAATLPVAGLVAWSAHALAKSRWSSRFAIATSLALALSLAGQYWLALPYPELERNPQFPDFEIERAQRERASVWMRGRVPAGPVIAEHAEEVAYYSGFPAVIMPEVFSRRSLANLVERYRISYLLTKPGVVPDTAIAALPLELVGQSEGHLLYRVIHADRR